MPGAFLVDEGDVQIGSNLHFASAILAKRSDASREPTAVLPSIWVGNNFNPIGNIDIATFDVPRSYRHGVTAGIDQAVTRRFEFDLFIHAANESTLNTWLGLVSRNARPGIGFEQELAFMARGRKYVAYGRYRGVDNQTPELLGKNLVKLRVRFVATDPVLYETTEQSQSIYMRPGALGSIGTNPPPTPYGLDIASWTVVSFGGDAPPRWRLIATQPHRNPCFFMAPFTSTYELYSALWCNSTAEPTGASGETTNFTFSFQDRKIYSPFGTATTDYYTAFLGGGSDWFNFDQGRWSEKVSKWGPTANLTWDGSFRLAYYSRNNGGSNAGAVGTAQGLPATNPTINWYRGYWGLGI